MPPTGHLNCVTPLSAIVSKLQQQQHCRASRRQTPEWACRFWPPQRLLPEVAQWTVEIASTKTYRNSTAMVNLTNTKQKADNYKISRRLWQLVWFCFCMLSVFVISAKNKRSQKHMLLQKHAVWSWTGGCHRTLKNCVMTSSHLKMFEG